jgi:Tol biopolymer transport system component
MTSKKTRTFGIYEVEESYSPEGRWLGYTVRAIASTGKQGKLYIPKDGREHYQAKPKNEELEI